MSLSQGQELAIRLSFLLVVIAALALGALVPYVSRAPDLDAQGCPIDQSPPHHVLMLVDRTDNLTPPQRQSLESLIQEISLDRSSLLNLPRYGKLSLYSFETNNDTNEPQLDILFSYCKPPAASDANTLYETPFLLQRAFEKTFGQTLLEKTERLTEPNTSQRSYIIDSLALVLADQTYPKDTPPRTLVIFSDMMENTPRLSHFSRTSRFQLDAGAALEQQPELFAGIDLTATDVIIIYLPRANARGVQGVRHQLFWRKLFLSLGADTVTIRNAPQ